MANYTQQLTGVIDYSCTQGGFALELWPKQETTKISSVLIYDVTTAFLCVAHRQTVQKTCGAKHRLPLFKATLKRTIAGEINTNLTMHHCVTYCLSDRTRQKFGIQTFSRYFPYSNSSTPLWPDFTRTGPPGTHTHTHTHTHTTDDNDIRPHTTQKHNERTST
jgi:hypothetical protein